MSQRSEARSWKEILHSLELKRMLSRLFQPMIMSCQERHLEAIEQQWGPAPGRILSDGRRIFILGQTFGNVFVGIQPPMGYEGDPMRLLFEKGFTPNHAFAAYYNYLKHTYATDAVLHFGTHGALEFMPGKQTGLSGECWPDRLIGGLPNIYLYAANNPSEGTIAKRRSSATLVSYLTPALSHAGLYKGLADLKASLDRLRAVHQNSEREDILELVLALADQLQLGEGIADRSDPDAVATALAAEILDVEYALIPDGLHVAGEGLEAEARHRILALMAENEGMDPALASSLAAAVTSQEATPDWSNSSHRDTLDRLQVLNTQLETNEDLDGIVRALDGPFCAAKPKWRSS